MNVNQFNPYLNGLLVQTFPNVPYRYDDEDAEFEAQALANGSIEPFDAPPLPRSETYVDNKGKLVTQQ